MKRACHLIGSTRPQSQAKLNTDIVDITFLVNLLVQSRDKIDFTGYDAQFPERLYVAARIMLDYFLAKDLALAEKLEACFEAADCERITGRVSEIEYPFQGQPAHEHLFHCTGPRGLNFPPMGTRGYPWAGCVKVGLGTHGKSHHCDNPRIAVIILREL